MSKASKIEAAEQARLEREGRLFVAACGVGRQAGGVMTAAPLPRIGTVHVLPSRAGGPETTVLICGFRKVRSGIEGSAKWPESVATWVLVRMIRDAGESSNMVLMHPSSFCSERAS